MRHNPARGPCCSRATGAYACYGNNRSIIPTLTDKMLRRSTPSMARLGSIYLIVTV
jgi:hypothetical protein